MKSISQRRGGRPLVVAMAVWLLVLSLCPAALADTGPDTPRITRKPDQLILQLGALWAGVEFELRTDAGVFPAPVVVDESGVLTMDLGGSTTYTLSCLDSTIPIPDPVPTTEHTGDDSQASQQGAQEPQTSPPAPQEPQQGIPVLYLVIFIGGLVLAVGGLAALYLSKRRIQTCDEEWDDEDEEFPD